LQKLLKSLLSLVLLSAVFSGNALYNSLQTAQAINISAAGDWGCSSNTKDSAKNIKNKDPELVLGLGDYSYQKTAKCWFDIIKPFDKITKINIGDHDDDSKSLLESYLSHFDLKKQYYSFDIQNIHVLTMATELELKKGSKQFDFVNSDLQKASKNTNTKWIIVNMHNPLYTSPNTCSANLCQGSKTLRDTYHKLFDKFGVDLVLEAKVHDYQRSFPIEYNPTKPSKPIVSSDDKHTYNNPAGEVFVIVGTGGVDLHGLSGKSKFTASQQDKKFGILDIQIPKNGNKLEATYYTNDGKVKDHFSIAKSGGGSTSSSTTASNSGFSNPFG
jgi:Calcineurin-like phosphoesterase